uniref:NuoN n=1 Tax=Cyanophora biloba TaxID=1489483 RepID=A0A873WYN4_9EUKA|nr:NuoN [Cyanophora biloba]QPB15038.1 NuoN [Cyanophora biloba]
MRLDTNHLLFAPQFYFLFCVIILLVFGIFWHQPRIKNTLNQSILVKSSVESVSLGFAISILLHYSLIQHNNAFLFDIYIYFKSYSTFTKTFLFTISNIILLSSLNSIKNKKLKQYEFAILIGFATIGAIFIVNSSNLLVTYLALELQTLVIYTLVIETRSFKNNIRANINYFVLRIFASGILSVAIEKYFMLKNNTFLETYLIIEIILGIGIILIPIYLYKRKRKPAVHTYVILAFVPHFLTDSNIADIYDFLSKNIQKNYGKILVKKNILFTYKQDLDMLIGHKKDDPNKKFTSIIIEYSFIHPVDFNEFKSLIHFCFKTIERSNLDKLFPISIYIEYFTQDINVFGYIKHILKTEKK